MAITNLSNIIQPNVFSKAVTEAVINKSALMASGAIVRSNEMDRLASQPGQSGTLPIFGRAAWQAPNVATADSTVPTPLNLSMAPQVYQTDYLSQSWATSTLTNSVSGEDILGHVVNEYAAPYYVDTIHQYALAKLSGLLKDNAANDSGDMIVTKGTDANSAIDASTGASYANFIAGMQSMGDARAKIALAIMHSAVFSYLLTNDTANAVRASATVPFDQYMGIPVILDDSMPVVTGTYRKTYTVYLLGKGSIAYGEADLGDRAVEVDYQKGQGNGFGTETLYVRKQMILHPVGFSSSATVTGGNGSPLITAYDAASAWDRKVNRKNSAIVALKVNA